MRALKSSSVERERLLDLLTRASSHLKPWEPPWEWLTDPPIRESFQITDILTIISREKGPENTKTSSQIHDSQRLQEIVTVYRFQRLCVGENSFCSNTVSLWLFLPLLSISVWPMDWK